MNIENSWTNALKCKLVFFVEWIMIGLFIFIASITLSYLTSDNTDEIVAKGYVSVMNDKFEKKGIEGRLYLNGYKSVQRDGYQVVTVSTTISVGNYETNMDDKLVFAKGNRLMGIKWHTNLTDLLKGE